MVSLGMKLKGSAEAGSLSTLYRFVFSHLCCCAKSLSRLAIAGLEQTYTTNIAAFLRTTWQEQLANGVV
jgi:hypothetical protein